jgi:hypothetical protein
MTDDDLWRVIMFGFLVGTPAAFVLTTLLALPATGLFNAMAIAVEPAFFSGLFLGGLVPLMRQLGRIEAAERDVRRTGAPAPAVEDHQDRPRSRMAA